MSRVSMNSRKGSDLGKPLLPSGSWFAIDPEREPERWRKVATVLALAGAYAGVFTLAGMMHWHVWPF
jgi:hypothetical protein